MKKTALRSCLAATVAGLLSLATTSRATLDLNSDGVGDVWAIKYNASALSAAADSDGDGQSNAAESAAGTNPFMPDAVIRVASMVRNAEGLQLTFPTLAGKRYQIQSRPSLASGTWTNEGSLTPGTGADVTVTVTDPAPANKYYRVAVQDVDTDGDGVNDWEEIQVGFDPNNTHSNGLGASDDLARLTTAITAPNTVAIEALDPTAIEPAAGAPTVDTGIFRITRTGGLGAVTVGYTIGGSATSTSDYEAVSGTASLPMGQNVATIIITPVADTIVESTEAVTATLTADAAYTLGFPASASVLITDNIAPNAVGTGGVNARYWNNTSGTIPTFAVPVALTRIENQINNYWASGVSPGAGVNENYFVSRYTGEMLPEFSQIYTIYGNVNTGGRLWVNGQLLFSNWGSTASSGEGSGLIELQAGKRYAFVFEHLERTGDARAELSWSSANQPKIIIPRERLFYDVPPQIINAGELLVLKNSGPYTFTVNASGEPTAYTATNIPAGWNFNTTTGELTGNPTQEGTWDITVTATNAHGSGSGSINLRVLATDGQITREVWTGVNGTAVADIPLNQTPTSTTNITSLDAPQNTDENFGARIRGYITAPTTGAYQFWLTANEAAELYISNSDDTVDLWKRAELLAPGTAYQDWPNAAKSELLWLEAGQRYYLEIRHKESTGDDHLSLGWLKPGQTGTVPSEIVPGYVLSPYVAPTGSGVDGTLYTAQMTPQSGALTSASGTASLRLSSDESLAILKFSYSNLSSTMTGRHVHSGAHGGEIIFDIDDFTPAQDGSYTWQIVGVGAITAADIVNVIKNGDAYINIHSTNYLPGEIKGYFRRQDAVQNFVAPAPPPSWTNDNTQITAASRFLIQATYGPTPSDLDSANTSSVLNRGYEGWIDDQFLLSPTLHYPTVLLNRSVTAGSGPTYPGTLLYNTWWRHAITAPDQLRQRVAMALIEILVASEDGVLDNRANAVASYYDTIIGHTFGNFRDLLEAVTLHPAMGRYLDMVNNSKPDLAKGLIPNENYAREILQLFSIGLYRMHPDGTLMLSSKGELIPTYDQNAIIGFAHAFTGFGWAQANQGNGKYPTSFTNTSNYTTPMTPVPKQHFIGHKRVLNNVVLPGQLVIGGTTLDPYNLNHTTAQIEDPLYQALPELELNQTHDQIFNHPNVGPFIARQLIQRLVTSTPSPGYIYRVAQKFADNGSGVRGDMKAVIKAILLDYEARSTALIGQQGYGKQREPVMRLTGVARAFKALSDQTFTYTQTDNFITIDTAANHNLGSGINVFLAFDQNQTTAAPGAPMDATYGFSTSGPALASTAQDFNVRTRESSATFNYAQTGTTVTCTLNNHGLVTGRKLYFKHLTGGAPNGLYPVTSTGTNTFTYEVADSATRSGTAFYTRYTGVMNQSGTTMTITLDQNHDFLAGDTIYVAFTPDQSATVPADGDYTVALQTSSEPWLDKRRIILTSTESISRRATVYIGKDNPVLSRTGTGIVRYSSYSVGETDTSLNQTPLKAPTVFNFFLPDYQFPGILAQAGLITPEFQLTSDTSVIRQHNLVRDGIYNPNITTGLASVGSSIVLDFTPWMTIRPGTSDPWTHNNNLDALIDELNNRLLAGQLPSTGTNNYASNPRVIVNAKAVIKDYVSTLAWTNAAPTATQQRDRLRAVIHLITTSPDFTIQR